MLGSKDGRQIMKKHTHKIITFTALMATSTTVIHFINRAISTAAQYKQKLLSSNKNYFKWRFGDVYYTKKGQGSPVLLIHDVLPGSSGFEWNRIEEKLSEDHTVYTVDLPGCGRSEKSCITYTNFVYVQMICDFIRKIIGEKTDIITSGFSGSFAIMACHNEKKLFNKLILINPPSLSQLRQMPGRKEKLLKFILDIPVFGTLIYNMIVSRENVNNLFIEKMYFNPFHVDDDFVDAYYEAAHKGGYYTKYLYTSIISKYLNINITHALQSMDNSIFILEGEAEPNGKSIISEYTNTNPSIETAVLKGTKHLPHVEQSELFCDQINVFL